MKQTTGRCWSGLRAGFTLAEMLVVIAIILILAALLFPVYLGAKEMGYAARCETNLHQLQIAVDNYSSDTQRFPPATSTSYRDVFGNYTHDKGWVAWWHVSVEGTPVAVRSLDAPAYSWSKGDGAGIAVANITNGVLWSRVGKELRVYYCPTFAQQQRKAAAQYRDVVRSYSMNTNMHAQLGRNLFDTGILPSQMILFMDEQMGGTDVKKDPVCTTNEMAKLHRYQRGHAVFVDGHVEKMK
jgi:prepilin-type N-terminal cleavage/methylation domain-containing protein/prepilin-type processing-associated H-X9-DG protein